MDHHAGLEQGQVFTSSACFGVWEARIDVVYVLLTSV